MKTEILYSRADWKFHKNRLGYDDVIDTKGRLVVTVSVMDIAIGEMFQPSYLDNEVDRPAPIGFEHKQFLRARILRCAHPQYHLHTERASAKRFGHNGERA